MHQELSVYEELKKKPKQTENEYFTGPCFGSLQNYFYYLEV